MSKKSGSPLTLEPDAGPFTSQVEPPAGAEGPPPVPDLGSGAPSEPIPLAAAPEGEAPKKRARHRRTKAELAAEAAAAEAEGPPPVSPEDLERTKAAFAVTFRAVAAGVAKRRGEHWLLTGEECDTLGSAWAAAVAPYLHKVGPAVPWVSAAVITWTVFQPRIEADQRKKELGKPQEGPPADNPPSEPNVPHTFGPTRR